MDLTGKLTIVTGVSKGVGPATVRLLLARGAVVAGRVRQAPAELQHKQFQLFACDVRYGVAMQGAATNTRRELGAEVHVLATTAA